MRRFPRYASSIGLAVLLLGVSSCSTIDQLSGPRAPVVGFDMAVAGDSVSTGRSVGAGLAKVLLACPQEEEASGQADIGPEGGTLWIGPHRLVVPAGAVDSVVRITGVAQADSVISVQFSPEGLTFDQPARLTLSYASCPLIPSLSPKHVAYTSDVLDILQVLSSTDDLLDQRVSADLDHFCRYAVAW